MDIKLILNQKFGFDHFRSGQEEIVRDVILGKDILAILPTGGGKSLCYQLPAYVLDGTVLIVSPLVSLMEDQVASMKRNGEKRVVALNSFLSYSDRLAIIEELESFKYIFISPEMLLQKNISEKLKRITIAYTVVDEAHCISQWGFDFRPEYLRIGEFLASVKQKNVLALTATADQKVMKDIIHYLGLEHVAIHKQPLDRKNISYSIQKMDSDDDKTEWIADRVKKTMGPGIIYVASRKRADQLAAILNGDYSFTAAYHAGMEQEDRAFVQEQFINGEIQWVCATTAFGMGIHKNDVRQVIHEHIPSTIANYVQEVGRAGRDGELSAATLLYTPADIRKTRFVMQEGIPSEAEIRYFSELIEEQVNEDQAAQLVGLSDTGKRVAQYYIERMPLNDVIDHMADQRREKEVQLQQMLQVIQSDKCIRETVLAFFGEMMDTRPLSCCSVCYEIDEQWLFAHEIRSEHRKLVSWSERLAQLLG